MNGLRSPVVCTPISIRGGWLRAKWLRLVKSADAKPAEIGDKLDSTLTFGLLQAYFTLCAGHVRIQNDGI